MIFAVYFHPRIKRHGYKDFSVVFLVKDGGQVAFSVGLCIPLCLCDPIVEPHLLLVFCLYMNIRQADHIRGIPRISAILSGAAGILKAVLTEYSCKRSFKSRAFCLAVDRFFLRQFSSPFFCFLTRRAVPGQESKPNCSHLGRYVYILPPPSAKCLSIRKEFHRVP